MCSHCWDVSSITLLEITTLRVSTVLRQHISSRDDLNVLHAADPGHMCAAPADAVLSYLDSKSWGLHTLQIPQQFKFDHLTITQQLNQGG